jgi:hypothetical protein
MMYMCQREREREREIQLRRKQTTESQHIFNNQKYFIFYTLYIIYSHVFFLLLFVRSSPKHKKTISSSLHTS